jgi:hypothetical protein
MFHIFRVFGSKCFIIVKRGRQCKFASKAVKGFLLGYHSNTRAYRVFNKSTGLVEVSCDIVFDETNGSQVEQVDLDELESAEPLQAQDQPSSSNQASPPTQDEEQDQEEYIAAGHCCAQLFWMRQTLRDYGYKLSKVPLLCDNESAIRMADNPVEHSRTKHIDIRYHFLMDHQQRGDIEITYVNTKEQLVDIFTKPLDEKTFSKLRNELNILDSRNFD